MKRILLVILMSFFSIQSFGQSDTANIGVTVKATDIGLYICPQVNLHYPINKHWEVNGRVGYAFFTSDYNHLYIQNGLTYKTKKIYAAVYPVWLRRFSKEIGYQTPSSIMIGANTHNQFSVEIWGNYWYNQLTPSIQINWTIHPLKL